MSCFRVLLVLFWLGNSGCTPTGYEGYGTIRSIHWHPLRVGFSEVMALPRGAGRVQQKALKVRIQPSMATLFCAEPVLVVRRLGDSPQEATATWLQQGNLGKAPDFGQLGLHPKTQFGLVDAWCQDPVPAETSGEVIRWRILEFEELVEDPAAPGEFQSATIAPPFDPRIWEPNSPKRWLRPMFLVSADGQASFYMEGEGTPVPQASPGEFSLRG